MKSALKKDLFREIRRTKNRFISIMIIIAMGAGFFAGVKATAPGMEKTAEEYFEKTKLMDFKILSTFGFDDDDIKEIKAIEGVAEVMPGYSIDLLVDDGKKVKVVKALSLGKGDNEEYADMNDVVLKEGRMPQSANECLAEESSSYNIGDIIKANDMSGDTVVSDVLTDKEFTIVGKITSPMYVYYDHGTSSVGDGSIDTYIYIPYTDFTYSRYTEVYVRIDNSDLYGAYTKEYEEALTPVADDIVALGEDRYNIFYNNTMAQIEEAQKKLDTESEAADVKLDGAKEELENARTDITAAVEKLAKGQAEYDSKYAMTKEQFEEADKQIADTKKMLKDSEEKLQSANREYEAGKKAYEDEIAAARQKLDEGWQEYNAGILNLSTSIEQISSGQTQYDEGLAQYNQGEADYASGVTQLEVAKVTADEAQRQIDIALAARDALLKYIPYDSMPDYMKQQVDEFNRQIEQGQKQLEDGRNQIASKEAELAAARQTLDNAKAELEQSKSQLDDARAQIDSARATLENAKTELDNGEAEFAAKSEEGKQKLDAAYSEIQNGQDELNNGYAQLEAAEKTLTDKKKEANIEFDAAKEEIEEGKKQIDDAKKELSEGEKEYNKAVADAESQIKDGAERIQNARNQVGDLSSGVWYAFTREDNPGYSNLVSDTNRIDAIAAVFPVFFFVVAALVCLTTMSRMVEEQRGQMGTLKALGYSQKQIAFKYFAYATIAGAIGCIIGIAIGLVSLPKIIFSAYSMMYRLPALKMVIPWKSVVVAIILSLVSTSVVTLVTCHRELKEEAAVLMRPKSPKAGKRILLERIRPIWSRMKFSHKVTARNLFRYKARMLMTVFGIAGCSALIVAGFGLQDSIEVIITKQFKEISTYDAIVSLKVTGDMNDFDDLNKSILANDEIESVMFTRQEEIQAYSDDIDNGIATYLVVPQTKELFKDYLHLHKRGETKEYELSDDGVIITEKLAAELGLEVGDNIEFEYGDMTCAAKIEYIAENYVYHYIYISPSYYEKLTGKALKFNSMVFKEKDISTSEEKKLSSRLLEDDRLIAVQFVSGIIAEFNETIASINAVVIVMILAAGALAFVVLYNLTNINISERVREIATIKVLGFYNNEVNMYIIRENIVLTIIGIVCGIIAGTFLAKFMILTIEVDEVMFGRNIEISSYIIAAILTAVFSLLVNIVMSRKMKKISMVESLKSIE